MSNFNAWLRELRAAGKGGDRYPQLMIDRSLPFGKLIGLAADLSDHAFACSLRLEPDASGAVAAEFTVTVYPFTDGMTYVLLQLTDGQTAALPVDADFDGVQDMAFDVLITPPGDAQTRLFGGIIPVTGKVTEYGS